MEWNSKLSILVNHNQDIRQLYEKGYALSVDSGYLAIRDIPYLDEKKNLQIGAIVSKLVYVDEKKVKQEDHQIFFCGTHPCQLDGSLIRNLGGGPTKLQLVSADIVVQRSFSNKPLNGFRDYFEKIESYVNIIAGPAIELYDANPLTFRNVEVNEESIFKYSDTLTSRAEIGDLSAKFKEEVVAIIGLGGTGAYLLDFMVKTPVKEIRGFDLDWFHVHNAFRSPGKLEDEELGKRKSEVYQKRYEGFRINLNIKSKYILADSFDDLNGVSFAFVCVDKGKSRGEIFKLLIEMKIPFIDVGMGLERENDKISGTVRTTFYSKENSEELIDKRLAPLDDLPDDIYKNNIQISELNALNACMAIIKYKQLKGFYADDEKFYHQLFTLDGFNCVGE
ncbi:ThiF family adenylyltransferase [Mariniphaga sediminis]|uniref:ThiF family adenylyltransferase n=1 Tax=Mariniphaga sediminis TaxID=1628158 RepID=A0A399CWT1_9BACT|nr:ThiF family adenylyltransferase [Mariniphaga sediminis]RIH63438.1 ThiF family adenylyltransferase [Mariniphaga sediminis]